MIFKKHILCTLAVVLGAAAGYAQTDMFPKFTGSVTNVAITHTGDKVVFIGERGEPFLNRQKKEQNGASRKQLWL